MEFKYFSFQAWKVMEFNSWSWKVMESSLWCHLRLTNATHKLKDPVLTIRHCARVFVLVFTRRLMFLRSSA